MRKEKGEMRMGEEGGEGMKEEGDGRKDGGRINEKGGRR